MPLRTLAMTLLLVAVGTVAGATDVPVMGLKLIVVDKGPGNSKAVFVAKDPGITKGVATDTGAILSELGVAYDSTKGLFSMPSGPEWLVNKDAVAKFVNNAAPAGSAVKVSVIKPGLLIKVVGKSLGDIPLDISTAPSGDVYVTHSVLNGVEEESSYTRHCTRFGTCSHKSIAGGTGWKLVCKGDSSGDPSCLGAPEPVCCATPDLGGVCGWLPSALTCTAAGGTPGAANSTCDSVSGTCIPGGAAGGCCQNIPTTVGDICLAGPAFVGPGTCPGTYVGSSQCTSSGSCL